jgi:hypothetical protein
MTPYYFRTLNRASLIAVGVDLGILAVHQTDEGELVQPIYPCRAWDEVGVLQERTGEVVQTDEGPVPLTAPVLDADGRLYWHVNMLFDGDLMQHAQAEHASAPPERAARIAQHIADSPQYFVTDEFGQPRKPNSPQQVFWL